MGLQENYVLGFPSCEKTVLDREKCCVTKVVDDLIPY